MSLTLASFVACAPRPAASWRAEDYAAYKLVRAIAGRRIAGSVWVPGDQGPVRISNARREAALRWFACRAARHLGAIQQRSPRAALVPFPDAGRVVGAPPSRTRQLVQAAADVAGLRVLDVLRWRQPMPRCRPLDVQTLADNLVTTGGFLQGECVMVAECVRDVAGLQAAADRLRRHGATVRLALSAGRAGVREDEPFVTVLTELPDVVTADL